MNLTIKSLSLENIKILKILDLVCQLNKVTKDDWFFDFSGHVDSITINYNKIVQEKCSKCRTSERTEAVYLAQVMSVEENENLDDLIKELETHLKK